MRPSGRNAIAHGSSKSSAISLTLSAVLRVDRRRARLTGKGRLVLRNVRRRGLDGSSRRGFHPRFGALPLALRGDHLRSVLFLVGARLLVATRHEQTEDAREDGGRAMHAKTLTAISNEPARNDEMGEAMVYRQIRLAMSSESARFFASRPASRLLPVLLQRSVASRRAALCCGSEPFVIDPPTVRHGGVSAEAHSPRV